MTYDERVTATRERFGLRHGAMRERGWKNVNWGLVRGAEVFWFGYGDLGETDPGHIRERLDEGEVFVAGWKDARPPRLFAKALGLGTRLGRSESIYVTVTREGVRYDRPANTIF
jgi:hypothetical protein